MKENVISLENTNKPESQVVFSEEQIRDLSNRLNATLAWLGERLTLKYIKQHEQGDSCSLSAVNFIHGLFLKYQAEPVLETEDLQRRYNHVKNLVFVYLNKKIPPLEKLSTHLAESASDDWATRLSAYLDEKTQRASNYFQAKEKREQAESIKVKDDNIETFDDVELLDSNLLVEEKDELPAKPKSKISPPPIQKKEMHSLPELQLKEKQAELKNQIAVFRSRLLRNQEKLARFGVLKNLFNKKEKAKLEAMIKADQEKIAKLESERLLSGVHDFTAIRSTALSERVLEQKEEGGKKTADKLYSFYEKYFMKKLLPEKMRQKMEKQGFLGRLLANSCTLNTALSLALLGGGLAVGGASIVGAGILSGRRLLGGVASGVGSYNIMKIGSDAWGKSHGWDRELAPAEIQVLSVDQLLNYLAHYEAKALLNGKTVDHDPYYRILANALNFALKKDKTNQKLDDKQWGEYLIKIEKILDTRLQEALKQKIADQSRLKYYATAVGVFVGSGMLQKTLGYLFTDKTVTPTNLGENVQDTLLAEQAVHSSDVLPSWESDMNLNVEDSVDYTLIPELAEQQTQAGEILVADQSLAPTEDLAPVNEISVDSLKESFSYNHPLIEQVGGEVNIVGGKTQVIFDLGVGGDFELKQQALRRVMLDVFPVNEVVDQDGLSALDVGRIESNVTTFTKLLEGKSFHGFNPDVLNDVMHVEGKQLIINDYDKLVKISDQVLAESKNWVPNAGSGFVRVGQNTNSGIWADILKAKLQNIKI